MNFREYRPKGTIKAAEIDVDKLTLLNGDAEEGDGKLTNYAKGDYAELRSDGNLLGWKKADFEAAYLPTRAPRQVKQKREKRKPTSPVPMKPSDFHG